MEGWKREGGRKEGERNTVEGRGREGERLSGHLNVLFSHTAHEHGRHACCLESSYCICTKKETYHTVQYSTVYIGIAMVYPITFNDIKVKNV